MTNKKEKVYVMLYKRLLLFPDYLIFLPCHYAKGEYDSSDRCFTDEADFPYYECDNYDIVTSNEDLTFFYDITEEDLKNMFQTNNLSDALGKFYEEMKKITLIGHINGKDSKIEISKLTYDMLGELSKDVTYKIEDKDSTVTLTRTQLKEIISREDISTIKKDLESHLRKAEKLKEIGEAKGIEIMTADSTGTKVLIEPPLIKAIQIKEKKKKEKANMDVSDTLCKDLYDYVTSALVGQDEAVKDLISVVLNNMKATNRSELIRPLVIGPTGSGKTFLFELLGKKLSIPVIVVDCNLLVQSGYEGQNLEDVLKRLYILSDENVEKANRAVVFLDEIDKLASRGAGVSDIGVQQTLLKFIEGHKYVIDMDKAGLERVTLDTSMMTIVAGGAFEELFKKKNETIGIGFRKEEVKSKVIRPQDIIDFGMISELIGRFELIVQYNDVIEEMIRKQLLDSTFSPIEINKKKFLRNYGATLTFSDAYIDRVCKESIEKKLGFRASKQRVTESLIKLTFALQYEGLDSVAVFVDDKILDNPKQYKIEKK